MSLFEWLMEGRRRGPVGTLDVEPPRESEGATPWVVVRGIVGLGLLGGGVFLALRAQRPSAMLAVLALYLGVSYFVRPRPDRSNLGLGGGLIDHPFRWSDDRNRALLFLQAILLPGRYAVTWARDLMLRTRRVRVQLPHAKEQVVWERGAKRVRGSGHQRERSE